MQLSDFNFPFDPSLVAKCPSRPRDHARLLSVPRMQGALSDHRVVDLPDLLQPGDVVVVNDTKVLPVRVCGMRHPSGGKVELLLVKEREPNEWEVYIKGRVRVGQVIVFNEDVRATVIERGRERTIVKLEGSGSWSEWIEREGQMPLPPYIKREPTSEDKDDYQTMFARVEGAIAAPTAGLHFTPRVVRNLKARGIHLETITLHVGPGTFRPVRASRIEGHQMDPEWFHVPERTADAIKQAREDKKRVVAVGTTVARTLEAAALTVGEVTPQQNETDLFIIPGFQFQVVDVLLTNFHLPGTTLLMLIAAFAGFDQAQAAYEHAIKERYRFYSYGDAMLIQ